MNLKISRASRYLHYGTYSYKMHPGESLEDSIADFMEKVMSSEINKLQQELDTKQAHIDRLQQQVEQLSARTGLYT